MRQGASKAKGANFEREVCRELSEWVSTGKADDLFWRSSMSGGRATLGRKKGVIRENVTGDLVVVATTGLYAERARCLLAAVAVEAKHLATIGLRSLILANTGPLRSALDQTAPTLKHPLVVARANHRATVIITTAALYDTLIHPNTPILAARLLIPTSTGSLRNLVIITAKTFYNTADPVILDRPNAIPTFIPN